MIANVMVKSESDSGLACWPLGKLDLEQWTRVDVLDEVINDATGTFLGRDNDIINSIDSKLKSCSSWLNSNQ